MGMSQADGVEVVPHCLAKAAAAGVVVVGAEVAEVEAVVGAVEVAEVAARAVEAAAVLARECRGKPGLRHRDPHRHGPRRSSASDGPLSAICAG